MEYGLNVQAIENRFKKLINIAIQIKIKETLFIWPEGVFSGYSYDEILIFRKLITKNFSKKHNIIFGVNKLSPNSNQYYNSMLVLNNNFDIIQSYNKRKLVPFGEFFTI